MDVTREDERRQLAAILWELRVDVWRIGVAASDDATRRAAWQAEAEANARLSALEILLGLPPWK